MPLTIETKHLIDELMMSIPSWLASDQDVLEIGVLVEHALFDDDDDDGAESLLTV